MAVFIDDCYISRSNVRAKGVTLSFSAKHKRTQTIADRRVGKEPSYV